MDIKIAVKHKTPVYTEQAIVCNNSDYTVTWDLDDEWSGYDNKTMRRVYMDGTYTDTVFSGATSALTSGGAPADPPESVYNQLMERMAQLETPDAVLYSAQELTDAQKLQARENIGALDKYNGMTPVECSYTNLISQEAETTTLYVSQGTLIPPSEDASGEVKNAWNFMFFVPFGGSYTEAPENAQADVKGIAVLAENGVFGADFLATTGNTFECSNNVIGDADKMRVIVSSASSKSITVFLYSRYGMSQQMTYSISNETFSDYAAFSAPLKKSASKSSAKQLTLRQVEMAADPTKDMQIATKKYVDAAIAAALAQK